ncbi:MAG: hypothetical protein QG646_3772 [Euryarchaeota archaeon]|nr:hypothetical protein [Euryarchaeota archaeon]
MEIFLSEALLGWQNFYMLAGTAAASLIGLLFIAVSMHIDTIVSLQKTDAVRALADQTFRNLIIILSFAFIFTIPNPTPQGTGISLLFLGLLGFWRTIWLWTKFYRISKIHILKAEQLMRQLLIPNTICYLALIGISISLFQGSVDILRWMVLVVIYLTIAALISAWTLMVLLAEAKRDSASQSL